MADHSHNSPNQLNENASSGKTSPPTSWKWKRVAGVGYVGGKGGKIKSE